MKGVKTTPDLRQRADVISHSYDVWKRGWRCTHESLLQERFFQMLNTAHTSFFLERLAYCCLAVNKN